MPARDASSAACTDTFTEPGGAGDANAARAAAGVRGSPAAAVPGSAAARSRTRNPPGAPSPGGNAAAPGAGTPERAAPTAEASTATVPEPPAGNAAEPGLQEAAVSVCGFDGGADGPTFFTATDGVEGRPASPFPPGAAETAGAVSNCTTNVATKPTATPRHCADANRTDLKLRRRRADMANPRARSVKIGARPSDPGAVEVQPHPSTAVSALNQRCGSPRRVPVVPSPRPRACCS